MKYVFTDNIDENSLSTLIKPAKEIPVVYIDLLDQKSGGTKSLELNSQEKNLIETYLDTYRSESPFSVIKRHGYLIEATIRTFPEDSRIYTNVHYSLVDIRGGEVKPIIVDGVLIVPERLDTAESFQGALKHHDLRKDTTLKQLRDFEKEYETI